MRFLANQSLSIRPPIILASQISVLSFRDAWSTKGSLLKIQLDSPIPNSAGTIKPLVMYYIARIRGIYEIWTMSLACDIPILSNSHQRCLWLAGY